MNNNSKNTPGIEESIKNAFLDQKYELLTPKQQISYGRNITEAAQNLLDDEKSWSNDVTEFHVFRATLVGHTKIEWDGREGETVQMWLFDFIPD